MDIVKLDNNNVPEPIKDLRNLELYKKRRVWKSFMEKYNVQKLAEIGVFTGVNFKLMVQHRPEIAVAVDAWLDDGVVARNDAGFPQSQLNEMADNFRHRWGHKKWVNIMRMYSTDAAKFFPDGYFDLIYIDADHTCEGCKADIEAWYPKVRKGGYVTGDDYSRMKAPRTGIKFGVVEAVNEFAKENNLIVYELTRRGWAILKP